jgi:hypothetical protein
MSLQRFIENINGIGGLAKTNRFKVLIVIPTILQRFSIRETRNDFMETLSLLCETAELPGKTLQTADVKVYGPTYKVPYQKQFQDINLTFLCSNRGTERDIFDRWIEEIMPSSTSNLRFRSNYLTSIKILHLSEENSSLNPFTNEEVEVDSNTGIESVGGRIIREVILEDAFPIGYAAQPLNWGDDGFQRLSVQFAYRRFK